MTNSLRQHRTEAGKSVTALAREIAVDPALLSLIERDKAMIRLDVLISAADALHVPMAKLYPDVAEILDAVDQSENPYEAAFEAGVLEKLLIAGIDPDPSVWVAIFEFAGGAQRRYPVNCSEKESIREQILDNDSQQAVTFISEARMIVVSRSATARCLLTDQSSYTPWDSREQGLEIMVVRTDADRPQRYDVHPDQAADGSGQIMIMIKRFQEGTSTGRFCSFTDIDETDVLLPVSSMAAVEVPLGILDPVDAHSSDHQALEDMQAQGSA